MFGSLRNFKGRKVVRNDWNTPNWQQASAEAVMAAMTMLLICSRAHVTKSPMIIVLVLSRTQFVSGSKVGKKTWSLMLLVVTGLCVACCDADGSLCSRIVG